MENTDQGRKGSGCLGISPDGAAAKGRKDDAAKAAGGRGGSGRGPPDARSERPPKVRRRSRRLRVTYFLGLPLRFYFFGSGGNGGSERR